MILAIQSTPPGPDICHLLGFCQTSSGISSDGNLLFLAAAFILADIVVHRSGKRSRK